MKKSDLILAQKTLAARQVKLESQVELPLFLKFLSTEKMIFE
jgi:hypothetical protein